PTWCSPTPPARWRRCSADPGAARRNPIGRGAGKPSGRREALGTQGSPRDAGKPGPPGDLTGRAAASALGAGGPAQRHHQRGMVAEVLAGGRAEPLLREVVRGRLDGDATPGPVGELVDR